MIIKMLPYLADTWSLLGCRRRLLIYTFLLSTQSANEVRALDSYSAVVPGLILYKRFSTAQLRWFINVLISSSEGMRFGQSAVILQQRINS